MRWSRRGKGIYNSGWFAIYKWTSFKRPHRFTLQMSKRLTFKQAKEIAKCLVDNFPEIFKALK